jgi:hypothetical protein
MANPNVRILYDIRNSPDALVIMTADWCHNCVSLKTERQPPSGKTKVELLDALTEQIGCSLYNLDATAQADLCKQLAPTYNGIPHFQRLSYGQPTASCAGNMPISQLVSSLKLDQPVQELQTPMAAQYGRYYY